MCEICTCIICCLFGKQGYLNDDQEADQFLSHDFRYVPYTTWKVDGATPMYWSIMVLYYSPPFESCAIYFHCGVNDLAVSSFQKKTKKSMGLWGTWTTGSHAVLVISHYSLSIWQIQWISKKPVWGLGFSNQRKHKGYSKSETAWHCSKLARLDKCTMKIQQ